MRLLVLALALFATVACKNDKDEETGSSASAELTAMNRAQAATAATATNSNGLTKGTSFTVSSAHDSNRVNPLLFTSFTADTDCAASGWPASGSSADAGYAMKFLMCSVLKRPDGPDTVRGGFDRITGMLCAIGNVTYDGVARDVTATFSTACFSQTFVTTACTTILGSSSTGPCSATITVTGYPSVTGVAPAAFDKYLTLSALSGQVIYTIAHKTTSTTISGALMDGLPGTADGSIKDAFAFHIDSATGLLRYEGRFAGSNKRHMRINLLGTINTSMQVTNVETLRFVQGENFSSAGLTVSVNGTPSAGRRIRIQTTSDLNAGPPVWTAANSDDNTCVGEGTPSCTSNTGIVYNDDKFFFIGGYTSSKTWFTNNSYLGSVSSTVDMDDIWD